MKDDKASIELADCEDNGLIQTKHRLSEDFNEGWLFYARRILSLGSVNTITYTCWSLQFFIGLYNAGRLNDVKKLDGMALGYAWANVSGFSFLLGIGSGIDTFVSQYFGKKDYKSCGLTLNKAYAIQSIVIFPCIFFQFLSRSVFDFVGIDPQVSEYSSNVTVALIPSIILYSVHIVLEKFLIAQRITKPQMIIQSINTVLFGLYCQIFVFWLDFGLYGIMMARAVGQTFYLTCLISYIKYSGCCRETLAAPSKDMLKGWKEYLAIAFPSLLMICLEWWAYQVLNLVSGRIGVADLAANAILLNFNSFIYLTCIGIAVSTGTLVGNSIGERNVKNAKRYIYVGCTMTLFLVTFISLSLIGFRYYLARLLTTDKEVIELLEGLIYIIALSSFFDPLQATLGKTLVAMGRQAPASWINLLSYYVIMIPCGIIMAFWFSLRVFGIWFAVLLASVIVFVGYCYLIYTTDWNAVKKRIVEKDNTGKD